MNIQSYLLTAISGLALVAMPGFAASLPDITGSPQMVVTVLPGTNGSRPASLAVGDVNVSLDKTSAQVIRLQPMTGGLADMQLFVLLDDSTRSASLSNHIKELKEFFNSLPSTTQIAVAYMRNGTFALAQNFTADHQKAAAAIRLPMAVPGANGSPYFSLSEVVKRWPSSEPANRRAVLMLTDGVDRYDAGGDLEDPYMDAAIHDAVRHGVMVYSIYLSGAGRYGRAGRPLAFGQSHLIEVGEETGGYAYFEEYRDPVNITPFLNDLRDRFAHQYELTFGAVNDKGIVTAKLHPESKSLKVVGPTRVFVP